MPKPLELDLHIQGEFFLSKMPSGYVPSDGGGGHKCVEHIAYTKWDVYAWEGFGPVSSLKLLSRVDLTSYIHHRVQAQWLAHTEISNSCLQVAGSCSLTKSN